MVGPAFWHGGSPPLSLVLSGHYLTQSILVLAGPCYLHDRTRTRSPDGQKPEGGIEATDRGCLTLGRGQGVVVNGTETKDFQDILCLEGGAVYFHLAAR